MICMRSSRVDLPPFCGYPNSSAIFMRTVSSKLCRVEASTCIYCSKASLFPTGIALTGAGETVGRLCPCLLAGGCFPADDPRPLGIGGEGTFDVAR